MLRVLTYHRIADPASDPSLDPSLISTTPSQFKRQMEFLAKSYRVVSMEDVLQSLERKEQLDSRAVLITFDDGYRDFAENAWPVLKALGLPAVLFVPTAYPDRPERSFWWDRLHFAVKFTGHVDRRDAILGVEPGAPSDDRAAKLARLKASLKAMPHARAIALVDHIVRCLEADIPRRRRILNWSELRALSDEGVAIGAHTRTHPALNRIPTSQLHEEIVGAQEDLAREIPDLRPIFCYPGGAYDEKVVRILRETGFKAAFTTEDGQNDLSVQDPLLLFRTNITPRTTLPIFRLRLWRWGSQIDSIRHARHFAFAKASPQRGIAIEQRRREEPAPLPEGARPREKASPLRVAYLMSRFPKLTETFVLYEIIALQERGVEVEIYPLLRERGQVKHPGAEQLTRQANFRPLISLSILLAHVHFIRRRPSNYLRTLFEVLRGSLPSARFFAGALVYFPKAVRIAFELEKKKVDHVHAHFANHPAMVAFVIHRLTGIPFSFTAHGSDVQVDQAMLDRKVAAARFVVSVSQYNKDLMVAKSGERFRSKIRVIHCGVDPRVFSARRAPQGGQIQIVCVASFEEVKGHSCLIEACRILNARGVDFLCHLAGDGPLRGAVEDQIRQSGLTERVVVHGALSRSAVADLMARADMVALASVPTHDGRHEGIPVVLMEAMASGLPVVASAIGGIPELVESGGTGILVPPRNPKAIADAVQTLAGDRDLSVRMGRAGREKVLREFNLNASVARLIERFSESRGDATEPSHSSVQEGIREIEPTRVFLEQ